MEPWMWIAIAVMRSLDDEDRAAWDPPDATAEQLREALHRYEVLVGQLADAPAPSGWRDPPAD